MAGITDDQKIKNGLRMPRFIRRSICKSIPMKWKNYKKEEKQLQGGKNEKRRKNNQDQKRSS